jgi:hypothetical protein
MCDFDGRLRRLVAVPAPLLQALDRKLTKTVRDQPDFWAVHDAAKPNKFPVFKDTTEHVVFGFPVSTSRVEDARRFPLWDEWQSVIAPIIRHVVSYYSYPSGQTNRIMLAKLKPGAEIALHIDGDVSSVRPHKIHVPLVTNSRVEYWGEDEVFHLEKGWSYEVNNRILHGGKNGGATDRVHLIFDYFEHAARTALG